jgi:sugar lactone lactonase YvrE
MRIRTVVLAATMSTALAGCGEATESEPVSPPAELVKAAVAPSVEPTAAPPGGGWPAVIVAERNLFIPEGIEFDQTHQRFLVGSLRDGTVYQLERDGRLIPVAEDEELVSSIGIEVDEARRRLLVANSDWSVFATGGVGHAKLGVFDLGNGERIAMVDLGATIEERTEETVFFANDVTVDDQGTIYVTDTRTDAIYRVDDAYQATLLHRFEPSETFRPNGIVYHASGYLLVVGGESVFKVPLDDPASASQVVLTEPIPGADGAVWTHDQHLAIVANRANRVVVLTSSDEWASAELVGSAPYEVMATTVAVVGDQLYVVHPHFRDEGTPSIERVTLE